MIRSLLRPGGLAATLVTLAEIKPRIDEWTAAAAAIADERIGRQAH